MKKARSEKNETGKGEKARKCFFIFPGLESLGSDPLVDDGGTR